MTEDINKSGKQEQEKVLKAGQKKTTEEASKRRPVDSDVSRGGSLGRRTDIDVEGLSGSQMIQVARSNSRFALIASVISTIATLSAIIAGAQIMRNNNQVAVVPIGDLYEYPMVHWVNMPHRYEESAKPMHVALKYVRGLYEVDPLDFSETVSDDRKIMLSDRISELLAYAVPGTGEYIKVSEALSKSHSTFRYFDDCQCAKRFLVDDMMIDHPPYEMLRIEMIGRYVQFGRDGRQPLPAEDMGIKSVVLYLIKDVPVVAAGEGGEPPKALNAEGWYVMKSSMKTITPAEFQALREIRKEIGMKGAL